MRLALRTFAALALALPAAAQDVHEGAVIHYGCDGGPTTVGYINAADGDSYAAVVWDGKMSVLKAGPTGSGVRYVSIDGSNLVWHTKGDNGFLARNDAGETMLAANCTAR